MEMNGAVNVPVIGPLPCGCAPAEYRLCLEGTRLLVRANALLLYARQAETFGPWQAYEAAWREYKLHFIQTSRLVSL